MPTAQTSNRRGCTTSPPCSNKWPPPLTCWALRSMRCRRPGSARKTSGSPTKQPRPPQRTSTSLELSCPQNHQKSLANSSLYIDIHFRAGFSYQASLAIQTVAASQQCLFHNTLCSNTVEHIMPK